MKAKSMKLRMLITLHALFKYSDENHRMNTVKLNEHLRPYGLECTKRVLADTANVMKEFGLDVHQKGQFAHQGVWIKNRPLSDETLDRLIFAVTTNPHLSKEEATNILSGLKPLVTVYQEPMLQGTVDTAPSFSVDKYLFEVYTTILEAIRLNRRIRYAVQDLRYDEETKSMYPSDRWEVLFTPRRIYQTNKELYMFGYKHNTNEISAIPIRDIIDIRPAFKHNMPNSEKIYALLDAADPKDYIPETNHEIIYKGPVVFRCRGQYVSDLFRKFGPPCAPVEKDRRCKAVYEVSEAVISSEMLHWIASIPDYGIRIKGPSALKEAVSAYYQKNIEEIFNPSLHIKKKYKEQNISS